MLQPSDNQLMRFSSDKSPGSIFKTKLVNLSETGAAFLVDHSLSPKIGDIVRVELPIPGHNQIAWMGRLVRMEAYSNQSWWSDPDPFADDEKLLVAIHFEELPSGHQKAIKAGLEKRFLEELRERRRRQQIYLSSWILTHAVKVVGYFLLSLACFGILYYLSRPSENYDAKRGAPWGQRFKVFDFEKQNR